jgi:phosphatidylinositol glycan class K
MVFVWTVVVFLYNFLHVQCTVNNWAILIDTSAYWFNYRHASNILGIYSQIKARGIPDSQIILMVAEDVACNARNVFPGTVVNNELRRENLMGGDVEIDYRGAEVSVDNLIRLLTSTSAF